MAHPLYKKVFPRKIYQSITKSLGMPINTGVSRGDRFAEKPRIYHLFGGIYHPLRFKMLKNAVLVDDFDQIFHAISRSFALDVIHIAQSPA